MLPPHCYCTSLFHLICIHCNFTQSYDIFLPIIHNVDIIWEYSQTYLAYYIYTFEIFCSVSRSRHCMFPPECLTNYITIVRVRESIIRYIHFKMHCNIVKHDYNPRLEIEIFLFVLCSWCPFQIFMMTMYRSITFTAMTTQKLSAILGKTLLPHRDILICLSVDGGLFFSIIVHHLSLETKK